MKIVYNVDNPLGDTLYLLLPMKLYLEPRPEGYAGMVVDKNSLAGEMVMSQFPDERFYGSDEEAMAENSDATVLKLSAGQAGKLAFGYAEKPGGRQLHISEGYAAMLGVLDKMIERRSVEPPDGWQRKMDAEKKYALVSPFSRSCSRHSGQKPNKTLDDWKWEHIIRYLRKHDYEVRVIGGPGDSLEKVSLAATDYLSAKSLVEMELIIRQARLVVTMDNGVCHVASALGAKTVVLWPAVSCKEFIAPMFSPSTAMVFIGDPNAADPAKLLMGIRAMVRHLMENERS